MSGRGRGWWWQIFERAYVTDCPSTGATINGTLEAALVNRQIQAQVILTTGGIAGVYSRAAFEHSVRQGGSTVVSQAANNWGLTHDVAGRRPSDRAASGDLHQVVPLRNDCAVAVMPLAGSGRVPGDDRVSGVEGANDSTTTPIQIVVRITFVVGDGDVEEAGATSRFIVDAATAVTAEIARDGAVVEHQGSNRTRVCAVGNPRAYSALVTGDRSCCDRQRAFIPNTASSNASRVPTD